MSTYYPTNERMNAFMCNIISLMSKSGEKVSTCSTVFWMNGYKTKIHSFSEESCGEDLQRDALSLLHYKLKYKRNTCNIYK